MQQRLRYYQGGKQAQCKSGFEHGEVDGAKRLRRSTAPSMGPRAAMFFIPGIDRLRGFWRFNGREDLMKQSRRALDYPESKLAGMELKEVNGLARAGEKISGCGVNGR